MQHLRILDRDSMNIRGITNLKSGGQRVTETTQSMNWSCPNERQLKYLMGASVEMLKLPVIGGKADPIATVWVFVW